MAIEMVHTRVTPYMLTSRNPQTSSDKRYYEPPREPSWARGAILDVHAVLGHTCHVHIVFLGGHALAICNPKAHPVCSLPFRTGPVVGIVFHGALFGVGSLRSQCDSVIVANGQLLRNEAGLKWVLSELVHFVNAACLVYSPVWCTNDIVWIAFTEPIQKLAGK